jgi:hypothetical protein
VSSTELLFPEGNLPAKSYQELYKSVYQQIMKDFHPFASAEVPPAIFTPEYLFGTTLKLLQKILEEQPAHFAQILYRVDLTERKAQTAHGSTEKLAELIVRREAQKVWLRWNFS